MVVSVEDPKPVVLEPSPELPVVPVVPPSGNERLSEVVLD